MRKFTFEEYEKVFSTNLIEYAKSQGFDIKKADRKSYKVKGYGGLYLFSNAFHHFSDSESGGIIEFAMKYQGLSKEQAIENILSFSGIVPTIPPIQQEPKGDLILPQRADKNTNTIKYLVDDRCIDKELIEDLIYEGKIFTAITTNKGTVYENCAFVSFYERKPKYCALRGLGASGFRQDVKNSDKTYGFSMVGTSDRVFCFESPIDLLSHATLCKLNGINYTEDSRISEGCLSNKALARFLKDNTHIKEIVFCFDNDLNGMDFDKRNGDPEKPAFWGKGGATKRMDNRACEVEIKRSLQRRNHGQVFAKKCADKFRELGYKTQIQTPIRKDWNEDLQYIQKSVINELRSRQSVASKNNLEVKQYER